MKRVSLICLAVILSAAAILSAQVVQTGWRVAATVKPGPNLTGAWEAIGPFDFDNDDSAEFIYVDDPTISGGDTTVGNPWTVYHIESAGDDTYQQRWSFKATVDNSAGRSYPSLAVGDLDEDGKPELYFNTPTDVEGNPPTARGLFVFEHDGTSFPTEPSERWNIGVPDDFLFISSGTDIGDVDGDGDLELVIQSRSDDYTGGRTLVVANSGGIDIGLGFGAFTVEFREDTGLLAGGADYDPRVVDFDGDGKNEIWVFTWDMLSLTIFEGTGPDTYALQVDLNELQDPLDYGHRRGMRFFDVNGDGKLEMYTTTLSGDGAPGSAVFYVRSTSDVSTLTGADVINIGGRSPDPGHAGSAIGDIDGDGLMDFLYTTIDTSGTRNQVIRMEYKGTGDLGDSTSYDWSLFFQNTNAASDLRNIAIGDFDRDDKWDVLVTNLDVASTDEAIIYVIENETVTSVQDRGVTLNTYQLYQSYPNPFNPTTRIRFNLPSDEQVSLKVYNATGQEVRTLIASEHRQAGEHILQWDGRDNHGRMVGSGVYLYRLSYGESSLTKTMTLVR